MIKVYKLIERFVPNWVRGKRRICRWLVKTSVDRTLRRVNKQTRSKK